MTDPTIGIYVHINFGGVYKISGASGRLLQVVKEPREWAFMQSLGWKVGMLLPDWEGRSGAPHFVPYPTIG